MKYQTLAITTALALVVLIHQQHPKVEHLDIDIFATPSNTCDRTINQAMTNIKRDCGDTSTQPNPIVPRPPDGGPSNQYIGKSVRQVQEMLKSSHPTFTVRLIKQGQPVTMDMRTDRIDVVYVDLPIPPNVMSEPYTYTRVVKVTFPSPLLTPDNPFNPQPQPQPQSPYKGNLLDAAMTHLKKMYPDRHVTSVRDGLQTTMRFPGSTIIVLWTWGYSYETDAPVYTRIVTRVMNLPESGVSPPSIPTIPPTTPIQRANIPSWIYNFSSQVAVNYLRALNPGFDVRRSRKGGVMTMEWSPKRITVIYNPQDRIVDIKQG